MCLEQKRTKSEVAGRRAKTTKTSCSARERKIERQRRANGTKRKEERQKLRYIVAIGFLLYPRLRATEAYGENFIFVHFSSSNQFQKLDYFLPSQSFSVRNHSCDFLHSLACLYYMSLEHILSNNLNCC